jgi:hypothetical protein
MFLELRSKLALFDSYVNPFHPRGALRLARYHPRSYLALTFLAAAGGYLFLLLFPALLLGMPVALYLSLPATTPGEWFGVVVVLALTLVGAAGSFAIATLRFPMPTGLELNRDSCPRLFELLRELADIYGNPRIDRVILRDRFDVRVIKTPRNGFSFATRNTLVIGLPLLLTLSPIDVHALIARRVGQLAGRQSRISSWLYYLRDLWPQYQSQCDDRTRCRTWLLHGFFDWFVPRYRSLSLGAARRSEMDADLYSLRAINDRDAVCAISAQVMIDEYLHRSFWPEVMEIARSSMKPVTTPHARMAERFRHGLPAHEMQALLRRAMARRSSLRSAVPSLPQRLENMGHRQPLRPKPLAVSAAQFYLGTAWEQYVRLVDKRSCEKVRARLISNVARSAF